jgi:hypothetical protein
MASQRRDRQWRCRLTVNMGERSGMTHGLCTSKRERCVCVGVGEWLTSRFYERVWARPNFLYFRPFWKKIHVWTLKNFNVIFGPFARRHSQWRRGNTARRHRL